MSNAGTPTASSGSHNSWILRYEPRHNSAAIAIASTTFAGSDGWKVNEPILIQRAAPSASCPLNVMNASNPNVTTYIGSAQRRQTPVVDERDADHERDPDQTVQQLAVPFVRRRCGRAASPSE